MKALSLFLFALVVCTPLQAQTLRVSIMHTEPWGFLKPAQEGATLPAGIWFDISEKLEAETGFVFEKALRPYARIWQELEEGQTDLSFLIRSKDREGTVQHAGHLFDFGSIIVRSGSSPLTRYEELAGLRIGVLRGIRLSPRFDADTDLVKIEVRDYETMVKMFVEGRLDAISGNSVSVYYLLRQKAPDFPVSRLVLQTTPVTLHVSRHYQDMPTLRALEAAVNRLSQQGVFHDILNRWAGTGWQVR
jgi:polar amino acid transport system substrate-binding protein